MNERRKETGVASRGAGGRRLGRKVLPAPSTRRVASESDRVRVQEEREEKEAERVSGAVAVACGNGEGR